MTTVKECYFTVIHGITLLLLIAGVSAQETGGGSGPPTVYARVGDTVLLPCDQELPTPAPSLPVALYLLQWQRTGSLYPFFVIFDSKSPFIDEHFVDRVSIPNEDEATLQITNVSIADAGSYQCKVTELITGDVDAAANGTFVNLVILYPPQFVETPPPSIVFSQGESQSLHCLTNGVPTPSMTWYRQGQRLRNNRYLNIQGGTITLTGVRREDGGTYICKAENSEGSVQDATRVIVEGAPFIFVPPHDVTVLRGQSAHFDCEYGASPSNVSQRWFYNDVPVQELPQFAGRHATLPSDGLSIEDASVRDEGRYSCSPTNGIGEPPVAFAHLTVQYPASVISMPSQVFAARSDPISIPCHSEAKPPVLRYVWRKNQREILINAGSRYAVSAEGNLTIQSTEYGDIGAYSCIPYNAVGTNGPSDAAILRVIEKPSFATKPRSTYELLPNETVTFPCTASGNPALDVQWRKVRGSIPPLRSLVTSAGLIIYNLTKEDSGGYECYITNEVAMVTAVAHLYIQRTTPHIPYNISVLTSATSAYVMWYPGYNGGAEQKFTVRYKPSTTRTWSQYTNIPETVHSVLIRDLQPSTEYQFSVTGENSYGASAWSESISHQTRGKNSNVTLDGFMDETPEAAISPPRNLSLLATSEGLLLSWLPPIEGANLVSHYAVEYWIEGPWLVLEDRLSGDSTEFLLATLQVNTSYTFRLIAFSGMSFSEPSMVIKGNTWGLPIYRPTSTPHQTMFDITGVLAGVVAGVFCFLCIILLACVIISCMQRRKRNKRMVFFSVVAHSDQGNHDIQGKPSKPEDTGCFSYCCCCCRGNSEEKPSPPTSTSVLPASLAPKTARISKTSIGGKAGVYHVSSSEILNTTVSGRVDIMPAAGRRPSERSGLGGSEAMEADEALKRIRLLEAPDHLESFSDENDWGSDSASRQGRHIRFQLTSTWGPPPKPDRGDYVYYHGCMLINSEGERMAPPAHITNQTNSLTARGKPRINRRCDTPMPRYDPDEWRRDYRMYLKPYSRSDDRRIILTPSSGSGEWDTTSSAYPSGDSRSPETPSSNNSMADHLGKISARSSGNPSRRAIIRPCQSSTYPKTNSSRSSIPLSSDSGSQETLTPNALLNNHQSADLADATTNIPLSLTNPNAHHGSSNKRPHEVGLRSQETLPSDESQQTEIAQDGSSTNTSSSSTNSYANAALVEPNDNVSYMILLHPGQVRDVESASPQPESTEDTSGDDWRNTPTLNMEREYTTRSFSTGTEAGYDDVAIEHHRPFSSEEDDRNQPSQDGDVEDNLLAYDEVPNETDSVFSSKTVHYDDVPREDLTYIAEELYASLRDEMPKRKFGVHEYALDDQSPTADGYHPDSSANEDTVPEMNHEYSQLERPAYPYLEHSGVRLSNDSGLNSDNSGPSEENDSDTLKSSLRLGDVHPPRHVRPIRRSPQRSSNHSLPRASIAPLSISTNQNRDHADASSLRSLPDFQKGDHRRGLPSPQESGYGSRNATVRPPSRGSGRVDDTAPARNLPNVVDPSGRNSANELTKYDPKVERGLRDALQRYYESDGDLRGSQKRVLDLQEKEDKERRCAELKREFEEYRKEQMSGSLSPRKTTVV